MCSQAFSRRSYLQTHVHTHTTEKQ
jgi:hypothetical protein